MMKQIISGLLILALFSINNIHADAYGIIQVYTQDELNVLIKKNKHLERVKADECQLVEDIQAHAIKIQEPAFVYLWGDMLTWGVCVDRDATLGMAYIHQAARQGLVEAIDQLGRYYNSGTLVMQDKEKAIRYFREAAVQGHLSAKLSYIKLLNQGYGSPLDFEEAYQILYNSIIEDPKVKKDAEIQLASLAKKMPGYALDNAKRTPNSF
jgi:TPR repeat protein